MEFAQAELARQQASLAEANTSGDSDRIAAASAAVTVAVDSVAKETEEVL